MCSIKMVIPPANIYTLRYITTAESEIAKQAANQYTLAG